MRRLGKPFALHRFPYRSPMDAVEAFQTPDGAVYLFLSSREQEETAVYCWSGGAALARTVRLPGLRLAPDSAGAPLHYDAARRQFACLMTDWDWARPSLVVLDLDANGISRFPTEDAGRIARFPDGEFLLQTVEQVEAREAPEGEDGVLWHCAAVRLRRDGSVSWRWRQVCPACGTGSWIKTVALPNDMTALAVNDDGVRCHLVLLDAEGKFVRRERSLPVGALLSRFTSIGEDLQVETWIETCPAFGPSGYTWYCWQVDPDWRVIRLRRVHVDKYGVCPSTVFEPDGVLTQYADTWTGPRYVRWLPYAPEKGEVVFSTAAYPELTDVVTSGPQSLPQMRRGRDGSLVAAFRQGSRGARFSIVAFTREGAPDWAVNLRCEGDRYFFLKEEELAVLLADPVREQVSFCCYRLPPSVNTVSTGSLL